ncbi:MAG: hypothetical protein AAFP98_09435 [Pseudomonadota bacterium]
MIILFSGLSACSSGGGGVPGDEVTRREPFVPITPVVELVPTGSATYAGGIDLRFLPPSGGEAVDLNGDLTLNVDFDTMDSAVSGVASGFTDPLNSYTGNLLVNTGALDDSAGGLDFVTNINGSLLTGTTNYLVLGQMRGEVLGTGQEAASGQISGEVLERGQPAGLTGAFQTARQP